MKQRDPLARSAHDISFAGEIATKLSVVEDKVERRATLETLVDMAHAYRVKPELEMELASKKASLQMVRLLFGLLIAVNAFALIAGCAQAPQEQASAPIKNRIPKPDVVSLSYHANNILVDEDTGCQYITFYSKAITPRMGRQNGEYVQLGCKEK